MTDKPQKRLILKPKATTTTSPENPTQTRTRSRKRIIRRDDLPAGKLSNTKAPPKPKKPRSIPKQPVTPPSEIRLENLNASLNGYEVWRTFQPLALGIEKQVFQHIAKHQLSASKRVVQRLLRQHTRDERYLQALRLRRVRYNLDGSKANLIAS